MTQKRKPWMKFYTSDWRADPKLRLCSFAARGLWADLLGLLWESEKVGYLLIEGRPATLDEVGRMIGATPAEIEPLLDELKRREVCSVTPDGVVFSRRMVRDHGKAEAGRAAIEKRWRPNSEPNRGPNRSPFTPETRDQKDSLPAGAGRESAAPEAGPADAQSQPGEASSNGKRATRIPDDWTLDDELRGFALERGLNPDDVAATFRDYWRSESGSRARKLDWRAAFRVWCAREAAGNGGRQRDAGSPSSVARAGAAVLAAIRA